MFVINKLILLGRKEIKKQLVLPFSRDKALLNFCKTDGSTLSENFIQTK